MKIGIYTTSGRFLFGDPIDIDFETITDIDFYGIWFYIKRYPNGKYKIISRFDNVKIPPDMRSERCVAVLEGESNSLYDLYKDFLKEFKNLIEKNGGIWEEKIVEPSDDFNIDDVFKDRIDIDKIEGIIKEYPSTSDRLKMIKLAEKILDYLFNCVIYAKSRPKRFEKCFWISSEKIKKLENKLKTFRKDDYYFEYYDDNMYSNISSYRSNNRGYYKKLLNINFKKILKGRYLLYIIITFLIVISSFSVVHYLSNNPQSSDNITNNDVIKNVTNRVDFDITTISKNTICILAKNLTNVTHISIAIVSCNDTEIRSFSNITLTPSNSSYNISGNYSNGGKYVLYIFQHGDVIYHKEIQVPTDNNLTTQQKSNNISKSNSTTQQYNATLNNNLTHQQHNNNTSISIIRKIQDWCGSILKYISEVI